jgi:DNA invertase Pin-like site-specific DNA recombinase
VFNMAKRSRVKADPSKGIGYIRVSTNTQRQELGAEAQRQAIEHWAAQNGVSIVDWRVEEISGGAPLDKRTGLLEAIALAGQVGAAHLVVHRLERFGRDPLAAGLALNEMARNGTALTVAEGGGSSSEDDPTAEMIQGILLVIARFDRKMIRARIKAALAVKRQRGGRMGEIKYGFRPSKADPKLLEPDPTEQAVIEHIVSLAGEGLSQRAIAARLALDGMTCRTGRPFNQTQVSRILRASSA